MRKVSKLEKQFEKVLVEVEYSTNGDGLVWWDELWTYEDGSTRQVHYDEPFTSPDPHLVAMNHDWDVYLDALYL